MPNLYIFGSKYFGVNCNFRLDRGSFFFLLLFYVSKQRTNRLSLFSLLQPVFVLHKAASRKYERRLTGATKTKRRIDLSPSISNNLEKSDSESAEDFDDDHYFNLRMEAFEIVWNKIESTIKVGQLSFILCRYSYD